MPLRAFILPNARSISQPALVAKLDGALSAARDQQGPEAFPRSAAEHLDDWAGESNAWLHNFHPPGSDDPANDLTPAAENAIGWLASLVEQRTLVATAAGSRSGTFTTGETSTPTASPSSRSSGGRSRAP